MAYAIQTRGSDKILPSNTSPEIIPIHKNDNLSLQFHHMTISLYLHQKFSYIPYDKHYFNYFQGLTEYTKISVQHFQSSLQ